MISVVIPVYNEEDNVIPLHEKLKATMNSLSDTDYEIIYVDDGSTDNTLSLLEKIQSEDSHVLILSLRRNFGQTAAFAAGFDFVHGNTIITMDGDLQDDPEDIPKLVNAIKDYDLVSGWRKKRKDPFFRSRLPSIIANWIIGKVTGIKLHDYGCSLKAYKRDVIKNLRLYGEMHMFIPAVASWYGINFGEIETTHHPRLRGKSKYGLSRTIKVILDLITVKFLQSFSTKPIQFFGPMGLTSAIIGILLSSYLAFRKIIYSESVGGSPLLLIGILLIIVGVQLIAMGLISEILVRVYHESQKKPVYVIKKIIGN